MTEPLFNMENLNGRRSMQQTDTKERLAELERRRIELMHELEEIADKQRARVSAMRGVERELKAALAEVEEHSVPEGQELTLEDVERWCRSAFFNMAHTMARYNQKLWIEIL